MNKEQASVSNSTILPIKRMQLTWRMLMNILNFALVHNLDIAGIKIPDTIIVKRNCKRRMEVLYILGSKLNKLAELPGYSDFEVVIF